ncbi:conserved protein of unknown function [Methylorubrum extorquens]|uniref:Uncharacterized protein n=1 Tax=Methylorubrum extorquens TaxID=408 RepID=A0A2N9AJR1_METEX|nr:conserved protein of unknown function [Methylorubrum extorquens]
MQYQRVTKRNPTKPASKGYGEKQNAAAGGRARNGANRKDSGKGTKRKNTARRNPLTSASVAALDREVMVSGVFSSRTAARSFLLGAAA